MRKIRALSFILAALLFAPPLSGALEIDGTFRLGNIGFTPTRASGDATYAGTDWFWGGSLSLSQDLTSNILLEAVVERDLILGNFVSALFQYRSDYLHIGMGPFLGFLNSSSVILKSGISTELGLEMPGVLFFTLRTDNSLGSQVISAGDYFVQASDILFGFYVRDAAICSLGLGYKQLNSVQGAVQVVDSLTDYSFDVKVFEKNVPFRLDFLIEYQQLLKQYLGGITNVTHGLGSIIAGTGIELIFGTEFVLTLGFRTSIWSLGSGVLDGVSDFGFTPLLFQASIGFQLVIPSAEPGGMS